MSRRAVAAGLMLAALLSACSASESVMRQNPLSVSPPTSPNWAIAAPEGVATAVPSTLTSPAYAAAPEAIVQAWDDVAAAEPRVARTDDGLDPLSRTHVQRSAWLRFPDIIDMRAVDLGEGRAAATVYSRSVYGYSDLGVNQARIERWLAALDARLTATQ